MNKVVVEGIFKLLFIPASLFNFSSKNFYKDDGHLLKQIEQHNLWIHGTELNIMYCAEDKTLSKPIIVYPKIYKIIQK